MGKLYAHNTGKRGCLLTLDHSINWICEIRVLRWATNVWLVVFFGKNAFIYQKDQSMCHSLKFEANSKEGRSWHSIYCIAKTVRWIFFSFLKQTMRVGKCCVLCSELCMQLQQGKLSMFVLWMNMNTFSRKHIASICSRKQECNSNVSSETSHTSERSITVMKKKNSQKQSALG